MSTKTAHMAHPLPDGDRILEPMIALACCSNSDRIIVAGAKSVELMFDLQRCGYARAAGTAYSGRPAGQYDVALVDWRRRSFKELETTLDWLVKYIRPAGVLVVWVDLQTPAGIQTLRSALERRSFVVEAGTVRDGGCAVSARRRDPISKVA
jgi:hypothetical protein